MRAGMIDGRATRCEVGAPMARTRIIRSQLSYDRVLIAAYHLSDADGLICVATNKEIARAAGVSVWDCEDLCYANGNPVEVRLQPSSGFGMRLLQWAGPSPRGDSRNTQLHQYPRC